jgi:hypothetical protein
MGEWLRFSRWQFILRVIRVDCFIIEDVKNVVMMKVLQQILFSWCKRSHA